MRSIAMAASLMSWLVFCLPGCDEACEECAECPNRDGRAADASALDAKVKVDIPPADLPAPDKLALDAPGLDKLLPDKSVPDKSVPDKLLPDKSPPDFPAPDSPWPTCTDNKKNGVETDVDCGGGTCPVCADGKKCGASTDCASGICALGVCAAPSCSDTVKNGNETDVDCGGGTCPGCATSNKCGNAVDCKSLVCVAGACAAPSCTDKVKNGSETDMDCGGGACPACADNKKCSKGTDCTSGSCVAGLCGVPSCTDKVKNGNETDVDCGGGVCPACAAGQLCAATSDCKPGICDTTTKRCRDSNSCKEILASHPGSKTGTYTIVPTGFVPFQVYCDMSSDGGGWTLVANYPFGYSVAAPPNWSGSSLASGSDFSSPSNLFKMSDLAINTIKTVAYKAIAEAKQCYGNASCHYQHTFYYKPACVFASTGCATACATAYLDLAFTSPTPVAKMGPSPCGEHWGLTDVKCGVAGGLITNHKPMGFVVCVGDMSSTPHACNGRNSEKAGVQIWVK